MRPTTVVLTAFIYLIAGSITFAIIRLLGKGDPNLVFVVAPILASLLASFIHRQTPESTSTFWEKGILSITLATATIVFGLSIQGIFAPFDYPIRSIPIATIGSLFMPFILFDPVWKSISRR